MARTNRPKQFERYLESTGRDISAYVAKSPDVSGVIRLRDRDQKQTEPPPANDDVDLQGYINRRRKTIWFELGELNAMEAGLKARREVNKL